MSEEVDLEGRVVADRYRVERRIGSGGMGSVWCVQHVESLERYALKALHPRGAQQRMTVERFMREARAATALKSRHIVKIIDAQRGYVDPETNAPMPFIVMELLEGQNLERRVVERGPLSAAEIAWVVRGIGRALHLAHEKGIVHRDLKPENVFLALDDEKQPVVKVCDFGIAKVVGPIAEGLMSTGAASSDDLLLGTPMYMSPEQIRDPSQIGPSTDQWALALLVHKALTGKDYFGGAKTSGELLGRILGDRMAAPSEHAKDLDPAFDAWFLRSCDRDPARRWKDVDEQVEALVGVLGVSAPTPPSIEIGTRPSVESAATGAPLSSRPPKSVSMLKPARRWGAWAAAAGATVIVGVAAWTIAAVRGPEKGSTTSEPVEKSAVSSGSATSVPTTASGAPGSAPTPAPTTLPMPEPAPTTSATTTKPTATKPTATTIAKPKATTSASAATKRPSGAPCTRGSECASGYCFAEQCQ